MTDVTGAMVTSPAATVTVNSLVHFSATDWAIVIVVIVIVVILLILYAVLRRRKKRIVAKADPNGTISPAKTVNVDRGADQALTIAANPHYQISDVQVDCESIGPK